MKIQALLPLLSLTLLAGCNTMRDCTEGNGISSTVERSTAEFTSVVVNGSFEVILQRGNNPGIRIEADSNLHSQIKAEVKGDELVLETDGCLQTKSPLRVYLTAPRYTSLELDGSGSISSKELISTEEELDLDLSGSGKINLEVNAAELHAEIDGSGGITLRGVAQGQRVKLDGSGYYRASSLRAQETVVDISGSGDAEVTTEAALTVDISGSGTVRYQGSPQKIDSDISGSGKLVQQ